MELGKGLKSVLISVLILGLVLGQNIQVDAKTCCRDTEARNCYDFCRLSPGHPEPPTCASLCDCKIVGRGKKCKPPFDDLTSFPHSDEADATGFCKLGCTSSVCDNINALAGSEEVNDAVERCNDACYRFCTKGAAGTPTVVA